MESLSENNVALTFDLNSIRKEFPILETSMNSKPLVFLDSAASSQKPLAVIEAMNDYYRSGHANVHRGVYQLSQRATDAFENARRKVQTFVNAASEQEIIFVRGATEAINLVANSFSRKFIRPGDEIVLSAMEHHSNIVPWQLTAEWSGAVLKVVPLDQTGTLDMAAFGNLLTNRTKLVSVTHVSNTLGTINPVEDIIRIAHERGIPVLLDGAQAAPHLDIDVQELDVDFYVFSGHKMYGPTGIGVLYGKVELLNQLPPYQGGGEMIESVHFEKTTFNALPFKFEAGTPDIAGAIGLGASVDFLNSIGKNAIHQHEQKLLRYATHKLQEINGLQIFGTAQEKTSVISFNLSGTHPYDVGTLLDKFGIAVRTGHHCTQPLMDFYKIPGSVRVSFGMYNTIEEVDYLVNTLKRVIEMLT